MISVMKFGGTSVGSAEALTRAAAIVAAEEGGRVVVVSAMSGVTNLLVGAVEDEGADTDAILRQIYDKHMNVARQLFEGEELASFQTEFEKRFARLEALLRDAGAGEDPYYKDEVTSQGERFSSLLLSHAIASTGVPSVALTSEEAGVAAEGHPLSGSCNLEKTASGMAISVRPLVNDGVVPVITGFYGINPEGRPLTFGRGGSDYAAAAIGNALDADAIQIWTDVDGFMTADPRIVPDAFTIGEMNFNETAELAHFGAKVLHPRTVEPARIKHISILVKNSRNPSNPGTLIRHLRKPEDALLRAVAMKVDLSIITVSSGEIAYRPRMVARMVEKIADADVTVYAISTSLSTIAFLVHNLDVKRTLKHLNTLDSSDVERIDVKSNVALICTVGDNLLDKHGFSGDVFGAVKDAGANVEMISEGASDVSLNFVVPTDSAVSVVKMLHSRFIAGGRGA